MCTPSQPDLELPPWLHSGLKLAWNYRNTIGHIIGLAAILGTALPLFWYRFSPTDLERAEDDLKRARIVIVSFDGEALQHLEEARKYKKRLAQIREALEEGKDSTDTACLAWCEAMADGNTRLQKANYARRDNLLHLMAQYLRLLAEAECEVLLAKDARDRGTPYRVAPRVRELLAPILADR